jgi:hypothetical protein
MKADQTSKREGTADAITEAIREYIAAKVGQIRAKFVADLWAE